MVCSAIIALDIAMVVSSLAPRNLSLALVTEEHLLVTVPTEALRSASVLGEDWVSNAYRRSVVVSSFKGIKIHPHQRCRGVIV
jgi:hypothetical protein